MNYLLEIKAFYDLVQIKQLSTGQIALWNGLMNINNRCSWIEWFTVSNQMLELITGLSRSGIQKARNSLKQIGVIDFKVNGTKATSYKMMTMLKSNQVGVQNSNQVGNQDGAQDSSQISGTLNKQNETKQNETIATVITKCLGLVSPFVLQECLSYLDELPEKVIVEALERTSRADGNWSYCKKILDDRVKNGIDTMEKIEVNDLKYRALSEKGQGIDEEERQRQKAERVRKMIEEETGEVVI